VPTPSGVLPGVERAGQVGFRVVTAGGGVTWQALRMPCAVSLSGVVWVTVPALPVRVMAWSRPSSRAIRRQLSPVRRSATRMSSSASQHSSTWARIRGSIRWNTGRSSRVLLRSRNPRSASSRFL